MFCGRTIISPVTLFILVNIFFQPRSSFFTSYHIEWTDYNMQCVIHSPTLSIDVDRHPHDRITEYMLECVTAYRLASDIFLELGNTGTSVQRRWFGNVAASSMPSDL